MINYTDEGKKNLAKEISQAKNSFIDGLDECFTEYNRTYSREIPTKIIDFCIKKYGKDFVLKTYDESVSNKITEFLSEVMLDVGNMDTENIFVLPGNTFTMNKNRMFYEYTVTIIVPESYSATFNDNVVKAKLDSLYDAVTYFTNDVLLQLLSME